MGISFPQQNGKRMGFRSLLPFFLSLFLFFAPIVVQTVLYITSINSSYALRDGVVDVSNRKEDAFQNTYIKGEVEFFYNEWIVSEPNESDPSPIHLPTPGRWTNRIGVDGEALPSSGYGSYRFWITGLEPGKAIRVFPNIEISNRIYLNGTLMSQTGEPSREEQSAVIALSNQHSSFCVVPEDGIVEYVMEVGNTGGGGASHIGFIHFDGQYLFSLSNPYVASVSIGVILAASVLLFVMLIFVPRKRLAGLLVGVLLSVVFLYLFSRDSFLVGASIVFSAALFDVLGVLFFGVVIVLLLLYLAYQRNSPLVLPEVISLIGAASLAVALYALSHGSGIEWLFLVLLGSIPVYVQIRAYIAYFRNHKNDAFLVLNAMACAYGLILSMFSMNFILAPMQLHPTLFSILFALAVFAIGFSEIYRESLVKRDEALLKQRYRDIVNRSLARLSSEEETIDTLKMIGASYERSINEGDRRLVDFTMLMRKRLMTLREPVISLAKECEIESELVELQNTVYQRQTNIILDVEVGELEVPPLIFEGVISELSASVNESDYVMISETKQGVRLSFPERLHISPSVKESIQERSSIAGMETRFGKGLIFLWRGKKT